MFTPETIINTIETAKLNTIEKTVTNKTLKDNMVEAVRAEARFAQSIVATTKNIADEVVQFDYENAFKPYTQFVSNLVSKTFSK